jgi:hypothetical protein
LGAERRKLESCCRKAMFSRRRSAEPLMLETRVWRLCPP